jgi:Fe-S cluster assembly scaffold protein SufB
MYHEITPTTEQDITITQDGVHIFYCHNVSADLTITLAQENAEVFFYGLYTGNENDDHTLNITLHHAAAHTSSTALVKSALDESAQFHFTGMIHITKKAHHASAHLTNNNLLLSPHAHVTTVPQLEVIPHEVTCTHAANTLPIDPEQIAYLMNRGISEKASRTLLIDGFCDEILRHKQ